MTLSAQQAGKRGLPRPVTDPNVQQNLQYLAQQIQVSREETSGLVIGVPYFQYLKESVGTATATADIFLRVVEPGGRKGTLSAWVNRGSPTDANPDSAPDATIRLYGTTLLGPTDAWDLAGGGTVFLFNDLPVHAGKGKRIFFELVLDDGVTTGKRDFVLQPTTSPITATGGLGAGVVDEQALKDAAVARAKILDGAVDTLKLADLAITNAKLALAAVDTANVVDGAMTEVKLGNLAVSTAKLKVGAVTESILAAGAITETKIGAGAVTTAKLANLAVTSAILAAGAVTETKITDSAITAPKIAANTITASQIATGAITSNELASNSVIAGKIAAGVVTATQIAANTITAAQIAANTITASQIATGAITATEIASLAVTTAKLAAGAVTATQLAAGAVTAGKISAGAIDATSLIANGIITNALIATGTITGNRIAGSTITGSNLVGLTITGDKISANAITADKISVSTLSAISANVGTLTAGQMRNSGNTAGISLSGAPPVGWTRYLDLSGSGDYFLSSSGLQVGHDGSASFSGTVHAANFTASSYSFPSSIEIRSMVIVGSGANWIMATEGSYPTLDIRFFIGGSSGDEIYLRSGGRLAAHGFDVYSPVPPKPAEDMRASDWLAWAVEDACKPVWSGPLPCRMTPAIEAEAKASGRAARDVFEEVDATYRKDVGKIAIGTARWADLVRQALAEATDFNDFKQRVSA